MIIFFIFLILGLLLINNIVLLEFEFFYSIIRISFLIELELTIYILVLILNTLNSNNIHNICTCDLKNKIVFKIFTNIWLLFYNNNF